MRKLTRCKWCVARVGHAQWFNERGTIIEPHRWEIPIERETNDGICPDCLVLQMEEIKRMNPAKVSACNTLTPPAIMPK